MQAAAAPNPLAPFFPPFTHFVIVYRENHTFDDYLGDCASTVQAGCNGVVQGTNHISSVPNLHTLAKTYALLDSYSTGTQPPSGPNHWWLFSAQSSSSSQQQSYPAAAGTQFDRFLKGPSGGEPFIMSGDFYWMLATGSGYWRNPATNAVEVLPVNRPGTSIPEELNYNHYTCCGQNDDDQVIANDYMNFVTTNGLPPYSYVELFNDHPGTYQDIPKNDSVAKQVVDFIMNNAAYKNNTLIVVTEDDTQNGSNGPDHVSNTYRVPTVIVASPTYMKQAYISHIAYKTDNVLAAMERVMENVHTGVIDPNNNIGLATFPMTTADQAGLGDPLEDLWIQGATPLSATAAATPTTGNAPFSVSFTGSASGGKPAYSYSWNFADGSAASTVQNPTHTYNSACTCTATLTVTDSSAPANTATSSVTITASPVAGTPPGAPTGLSASVGNARISLSWSAPASNGGVNITSYNVYRGTSSGAETLLTTGGCSSLGVVLSCTDTGLTNGQSYFYKVSAPNSLQFNRASPTCDYNPSSGRTRGFATSPAFDISTASGPTLTFNTKYQVESYSGHTDQMKVQAKTASGTWTTLWTRDSTNPAQTSFTSVSLDLSAYKSSGSQVRFSFDSMDTYSRSYPGWAIDDVVVQTGGGAATATPTPVAASPTATPTATSPSTCTSSQLLGNPGFETSSAAPWSATSGVINTSSSEPPHTGNWDAWLDGYGTTHTDTLAQSITLPAGCSSYQFSFWLHIDTAETSTTTAYDTLTVQVLSSYGNVLATLATYSNLDHNTGYTQKSFSLAAYAGQTITLKFTGTEDYSYQTSFVLDDTAVNVQ